MTMDFETLMKLSHQPTSLGKLFVMWCQKLEHIERGEVQ